MRIVIKSLTVRNHLVADLSIIGPANEVNIYFWQSLNEEGIRLSPFHQDLLALHFAFNLTRLYLPYHEIEFHISNSELFNQISAYLN